MSLKGESDFFSTVSAISCARLRSCAKAALRQERGRRQPAGPGHAQPRLLRPGLRQRPALRRHQLRPHSGRACLLKGREYNRNKAMEGFDKVNDPRIACAVHQGGYGKMQGARLVTFSEMAGRGRASSARACKRATFSLTLWSFRRGVAAVVSCRFFLHFPFSQFFPNGIMRRCNLG